MNLELLWKIPLFVLVAAWGIYFWSVPSAKHKENMANLRQRWRSWRYRASQKRSQ